MSFPLTMYCSTNGKEKPGRLTMNCQIYHQFNTDVTVFRVRLIPLFLYKAHFLEDCLLLNTVKCHTVVTPMLFRSEATRKIVLLWNW